MGEKRGMKALELWCKRVCDGYSGVKVDNMTTSWRDGLAFCALIHHFRPDLIDFSSLTKDNIYSNNELAFRTAECHLGIPALLDAEDMVKYEVPDRLSILTYLSQFYQTFASHPSSPVKRSPDSPGCSLSLSPSVSSSPPKEGLIGDQCVECGLPVFSAQRLLVETRLYHRTCFRCANCSSQLTAADCYKTEGGVFCCENCSDEEMTPVDVDEVDRLPPQLCKEDAPSHIASAAITARDTAQIGLRCMTFEDIAHTDDDNTPGKRQSHLRECDKSDAIDKQPTKISLCSKKHVDNISTSCDRLSISNDESDLSTKVASKSDHNFGKGDETINGDFLLQ